MTSLKFPALDQAMLPDSVRQHVAVLESKGIDTSFHRYMAHSPLATDFYWGDFYGGLFEAGVVPRRTKEIVRLVLAAVSGCPFCRSNDIESALAHGVSEEEVQAALALDLELLAPVDRLVANLATRMSPFAAEEPLTADDWAALRNQFTEQQLAELLMCTAVLAGVGRMLAAAGFIPLTCSVEDRA